MFDRKGTALFSRSNNAPFRVSTSVPGILDSSPHRSLLRPMTPIMAIMQARSDLEWEQGHRE